MPIGLNQTRAALGMLLGAGALLGFASQALAKAEPIAHWPIISGNQRSAAFVLLPRLRETSAIQMTPAASLSTLFLLGSGSTCVTLAYDTNGNRTTQTTVTISSTGAKWGSATFGCFIWY